LFVTLWKTAS